MKRINVIYDDAFDDVDILLVPDDVADHIEQITQEFFNWLAVPENGDRFRTAVIGGRKVLSIGTDEFIWWLNHVKIAGCCKAAVDVRNTNYDSSLPAAEF